MAKYDVVMIQEFLEHLMWEMRILAFETEHPGAVNEELLDQLAKYTHKYRCGLYPVTRLDDDDCTKEEFSQASATLLGINKRLCSDWLKHLEALKRLFEDALQCASMGIEGTECPSRVFKVKDILEGRF